MEYYDVQWLREHFRSNAVLLSEELHEEYTTQLKKYIRPVFADETYSPTDVDFTKMQDITKSEWDRYEQKYRSMGGFDHADRTKPQT